MSEPKAEHVAHPLWDSFNAAHEQWGFNCGPGAVCGVLGMTPEEVRPVFDRCGFNGKRYTNPKMMFEVLNILRPEHWTALARDRYPTRGLLRIQWAGPWTKPGVPARAAYRHTHWIGYRTASDFSGEVFDVNCACVGGWVSYAEWTGQVVAWLLKETCPKADGTWWATHSIEVYDK